MSDPEELACTPTSITLDAFNPYVKLPFDLTVEHLFNTMRDFLNFLGLINRTLHQQKIERLETMMQPAGFSGLVGEFMVSRIPQYCGSLAKNRYHNGHPDLVPAGRYSGDAVQYADEGIEVKASRYTSGWQGHNPENAWLMVFVFDSNRPRDLDASDPIIYPFRFLAVYGAQLTMDDWRFSGRSATSRRTITASVTAAGREKMIANWIYKAPKSPATELPE